MKMRKSRRLGTLLACFFSVPFYPFVFSVYPVMALLAFNVGQVKLEMGSRPALVSLFGAALLFGLLFLLLRNAYRAAFLTTLWLVLFFSYGHLHIFLTEKLPETNFTGWLLAFWLALAIFFFWWATRPRLSFAESTVALNVIALGLVIVSLVQISSGSLNSGGSSLGLKNAPVQELVRPENPPDVYFGVSREGLYRGKWNLDSIFDVDLAKPNRRKVEAEFQ